MVCLVDEHLTLSVGAPLDGLAVLAECDGLARGQLGQDAADIQVVRLSPVQSDQFVRRL